MAPHIIRSKHEVLAYSENGKRWIPSLRIVNIDRKHAWINTGQRLVKPHIAGVLPKLSNDDSREIISMLKAMETFSTGGPSGVLITQVMKPNDPRGLSSKFNEKKMKRRSGLLKQGPF